jgi:4-amino-4-deoxy-L-arabinose transferase-like glycosyltransferase
VALAVLAVFYLLTTVPNLANDPIVGGDEGWIMSASEKLAREGVFGSDLFAGFYNAEERYYFNLPLHHLVLAGVFKVAGVGLAQARMVGVVFGLAALVLTYLLGRRLGGAYVGLGAAVLLVLLRLNLTPFTGLTLTDLGAIVRYDLVTVPYALGAVYLLARSPERPTLLAVAGAGLLLGLASLTQFIGAFFILPVALFLLTTALPRQARVQQVAVLGVMVLLPFLPYFAFIAQDVEGFRGQARAVEQETSFLSPSFYLENLRSEPDRYATSTGLEAAPDSLRDVARRPSARLAMFLVAPLALAAAAYQGFRGSANHRLLTFLLLALVVEFALFESTKRFVYWVAVVPFLCLAIADLGRVALQWRPGQQEARWLAAAGVAVVAVVFAIEGRQGHRRRRPGPGVRAGRRAHQRSRACRGEGHRRQPALAYDAGDGVSEPAAALLLHEPADLAGRGQRRAGRDEADRRRLLAPVAADAGDTRQAHTAGRRGLPALSGRKR